MKYAIQETIYSFGSRFLPVKNEGIINGWMPVPATPEFKSKDSAEAWLRNKLNPPESNVIYHEFVP